MRPYLVRPSKRNYPDFIIIGAQKSGTTTLSYNLNYHPGIYVARTEKRPELHFFNHEKYWELGPEWYKGHFPKGSLIQGEKTPEYLFSDKCHKRMHQLVPNAKLIILLRNPVDRAYSQWNHYNQVSKQKKIDFNWQQCSFKEGIRSRVDLIDRGKYMNQIKKLLMFYPRDQVHIGIAEKLKNDPHSEFNNILSFLDVAVRPIYFHNCHVRTYPAPMQEETRALLQDLYRPFNQQLFDFLGYEVEEWSA